MKQKSRIVRVKLSEADANMMESVAAKCSVSLPVLCGFAVDAFKRQLKDQGGRFTLPMTMAGTDLGMRKASDPADYERAREWWRSQHSQ